MKNVLLSVLVSVFASSAMASDDGLKIGCQGQDYNGMVLIHIDQESIETNSSAKMDVLLVPEGMTIEDAVKNGFSSKYENVEVIGTENFLFTYIVKEEEGIELFKVILTEYTEGSEEDGSDWSAVGVYRLNADYEIALQCGPSA